MWNGNKPSTRREFLRTSSTAALVAALPVQFNKYAGGGVHLFTADEIARAEALARPVDPIVARDLVMRAIDAARSAGATYADARVTRRVAQDYSKSSLVGDDERLAIGVRALVDGAWGFAASPYWELDEAAQLARDAVAQATVNARSGVRRAVELGKYPVASGSWSTPIRIDPFQIPIEEKQDFAASFSGLGPTRLHGRKVDLGIGFMSFVREERAVATTDGAYFTQTVHQSGGSFAVVVTDTSKRQSSAVTASGRGISMAGAGWERILDARLRDQIPQLMAEAEELLTAPGKPVEIGRFNLVCDAATMAVLVDGTLGKATELDRVLGYEANAGGTSYLGPDPLDHLGATLGSPLLNVTANRSLPKGLATLKWDDEGVEPDEFALVSNGVLQDCSTTREQAAWLAPWYQKQNRATRSHGCAVAASALAIPQTGTPNIMMQPGTKDIGFDELVANTKTGLAVMRGYARLDFQSRTGQGSGLIREIVNGKLGAIIVGAGYLFDSTQLWKNLHTIGGASSVEAIPCSERKGEPAQSLSHTTSAVPGVLKDMPIVDMRRKA